jgi:hypothetical protein
MFSRIALLAGMFVGVASAATITVSIVGTTNTQATLAWSNSDTACTVEVSESATYSPLVNDVNPALFSNSNLSSRPEAITSGSNHVFPVGKRLIETALTAANRSRGLQTHTTHYYRVSCNSGADTGTGTFTTANTPFGNTWADEFQLSAPDTIVYPSIANNDRSQRIIDQRTGLLFQPLSIANDVTSGGYVLGNTSAGFDVFCNNVLSANGYYHCAIPGQSPNNFAPSLYGIKPDGTTVFEGTLYFFGQGYGWQSGVTDCQGGVSARWDETDPNVYYCPGIDGTTGGLSLAKLTLTGNDAPVTIGNVGAGAPPPASFTVSILTPYPNTLYAALQAYAPELAWSCSGDGYQNGYLMVSCRVGPQDTFAWFGAYNLGNKLPLGSGGTGAVVAMFKMWENPASRWCTDHTYEYTGNINLLSHAMQTPKGNASNWPNTAGDGPWEVTLLTNMTAQSPGTTTAIQVTSVYDAGWGTVPPAYVTGDPVSVPVPHYIMHVAVGDFISFSNGNTTEYMEITVKTDATHWTVKRGVNGTSQTHANGDVIRTRCNAGTETNPEFLPYMWWKFLSSPDGSANYGPNFGTHPLLRGNVRADTYAFRNGDPTNTATWGMNNYTGSVAESYTFAGGLALAGGEQFHKHPAGPTDNSPWGIDVLPFVGGNSVTQPNPTAVTFKTGTLWQYHYNGDNVTGYFLKQLTHYAINGTHSLLDISGPGVTLPSDSSGNYKYCVANAANECFAGAVPGDIYFNVPTLTTPYCGDPGPLDICIGNMPTMGFGSPQLQWIDNTTGTSVRMLTKSLAPPRGSSTSNVKMLHDGSWFMEGCTADSGYAGFCLFKIPPITASDGVNRTTFVRAPLALTAPIGLGVTAAKVYFGYTEEGTQGQYYCTTRREACVAVLGTVTDATPFSYATTDSYSPLACVVACTITLPVLPMHTAYFLVSYLDSGGTQVATESGVAVESSYILNGAIAGGTVSNVDFSPAAGSFGSPQSVTMTTSTSGAAIHYTADGSSPTCASTLYSSPVSVTVTTTLRAIGCKTGMTDSGITTGTYTITVSNSNEGMRGIQGGRSGVVGR